MILISNDTIPFSHGSDKPQKMQKSHPLHNVVVWFLSKFSHKSLLSRQQDLTVIYLQFKRESSALSMLQPGRLWWLMERKTFFSVLIQSTLKEVIADSSHSVSFFEVACSDQNRRDWFVYSKRALARCRAVHALDFAVRFSWGFTDETLTRTK